MVGRRGGEDMRVARRELDGDREGEASQSIAIEGGCGYRVVLLSGRTVLSV